MLHRWESPSWWRTNVQHYEGDLAVCIARNDSDLPLLRPVLLEAKMKAKCWHQADSTVKEVCRWRRCSFCRLRAQFVLRRFWLPCYIPSHTTFTTYNIFVWLHTFFVLHVIYVPCFMLYSIFCGISYGM